MKFGEREKYFVTRKKENKPVVKKGKQISWGPCVNK